MDWFVEFFAKYWLTCFFGLIATGLAFVVKHYRHLIKKEKEAQKQTEFNNIIKDMKEYVDATFKGMQESHEKLYKAVLDVQSKQFQRDCYTYLTSTGEITFEEFNSLYTNYEIYKSLGGNGIGSMLFDKVEEKYSNQLFSEQILDATMMTVQKINQQQAVAAQTTPSYEQQPPMREYYYNKEGKG